MMPLTGGSSLFSSNRWKCVCSLKYLPLKFTYASVSVNVNTLVCSLSAVHSSYLFCLHCFVIVIVHKSGVLASCRTVFSDIIQGKNSSTFTIVFYICNCSVQLFERVLCELTGRISTSRVIILGLLKNLTRNPQFISSPLNILSVTKEQRMHLLTYCL